jgi:hypothetical protein
MAGMKYVATLLASVMILPSSATVVNMFSRHENQREALRNPRVEVVEVVEADEEAPVLATPSVGIGRENVPVYARVTDDELEMLVILCYLEAGGESDACVRAVAEVIFNRVDNGAWGDTVYDVIHAPGEFEPAGSLWEFHSEGNAFVEERLDEIRHIVRGVWMYGVSIPSNVMFFRTDYYHAWAGAVDEFAIGNVYFSSSRWV